MPWYPTQAKTGLEWGTQQLLTMKQSKKVTASQDDDGEESAVSLPFNPAALAALFSPRDAADKQPHKPIAV